ncbi:hypothetical protein QBC39DRAFT_375133 [Podospora conica]|nr:hypothetical protein QBC39DRAFT_375133 [Schizothecium conicum]
MRLVSGGGLKLELHPDRAMDIGAVTVDGVLIAWMSPVGMASPAAYDSAGSNWLRTFGGGLLATCGLENHGPAGVDGMLGENLGLRRRITVPLGGTAFTVSDIDRHQLGAERAAAARLCCQTPHPPLLDYVIKVPTLS